MVTSVLSALAGGVPSWVSLGQRGTERPCRQELLLGNLTERRGDLNENHHRASAQQHWLGKGQMERK